MRPQKNIVKTKTVSRLLIVDDHPVFRLGLRGLLSGIDGIEICGEAGDAREALASMRSLHPDVAIVDVSMPGTNGIELVKAMLAEQPRLLILVISMHDASLYALRALQAGARGYIMKQNGMEEIQEALRKIISGGTYLSAKFGDQLVFKSIQRRDDDPVSPVDKLSKRELEVLKLFGERKTTREVAESLRLSMKTVETHCAHIKEKLGFDSAHKLMAFAKDWVATTEV